MLTHTELEPASKAERIQIVDALRGFAIWGILMVNIDAFTGAYRVISADPINGALKDFIIEVFFMNKFYSLFSLLFGLGLAIQMSRAEAKGRPFIPLYVRRLLWLAAFGSLHAILFWNRDILVEYAILGLLVLPLRKLNPKALLITGITIIILRATIMSSINYYDYRHGIVTSEKVQEYLSSNPAIEDIYATGTFGEITAVRFQTWWLSEDVAALLKLGKSNPWFYLFLPFAPLRSLGKMADVLALFMIGMAVGKLGLLHDVEGNLHIWKKLFWWCFPIGLAMQIGAELTYQLVDSSPTGDLLFALADLVFALASIFTVGIVAGVVLLSRKARWLNMFAPVGRMALTNYLMHSIVFTTIFYGYGLGLYRSIGILELGLAIVMIAFQIGFSAWWLKRYKFGPFEWLWRSLTYGKFQPMRLKIEPVYQGPAS